MTGALALGWRAPTPAIGLAVVALVLAWRAWGGLVGHGPRRGQRSGAGFLALGIGVLLIAGRGAAGASTTSGGAIAAARTPFARYEADVESIGSPKGAEQIALLRLDGLSGPAGDGTLVETLLPRYPEIGAGDRVAVSGRLEPPGPDDFGAYLRRLGAAGSLRSPTLELIAGPTGPQGILDRLRRGSADVMIRALPYRAWRQPV